MKPFRAAAAAVFFCLLLPMLVFASDGDYEKAVAYLRAGKAEEALRHLKPLSASDPGNPYVRYHIGLAEMKLGRLDAAWEAFVMTGELAKGGGREFALGSAFTNLGTAWFRNKDYDSAERCFIKAAALDPADGDSRYYTGLIKAERGEHQAALGELGAALKLKGGDKKAEASIRNAMGIVRFRQDDRPGAMGEFARTLALDPENVEALYYGGLISYMEEGYQAAKPYFDRIMKAPGASDDKTGEALFNAFFNIGVDFQDRDKPRSAADMFSKAIGLRPSDADAYYFRGYNLVALERYEEAADDFRKALALDPGNAKAKAQLEVAGKFAAEAIMRDGESLMARGEYRLAVSRYDKAVRLDPGGAEGRKALNAAQDALKEDTARKVSELRALMAKDEYVRAGSALQALEASDPDSSDAKAAGAEYASRRKAALDTLSAKGRDALGREALGEAAALYSKTLAIDPDDKTAKALLDETMGRIEGERAKAKKALEEGRLLAARRSFEKLLKFVPGDSEAASGINDALDRIAADISRSLDRASEALSSDDIEKAGAAVENALGYEPENQAAQALKKMITARAQEVEAARLAQERAERAERERAERAEREKAEREKAQRASVTLTPADEAQIRTLYLQGVEHYTKGELADAVARWREILKLDPHNEKAVSSIHKAEEKLRE